MLKGELSCGFAFEVDEKVLDNMELVDAIGEADTNPLAVVRVFNMLLGEEQKQRLYNYLRNEEGRVPVKAAAEALAEIFKAAGQKGKN